MNKQELIEKWEGLRSDANTLSIVDMAKNLENACEQWLRFHLPFRDDIESVIYDIENKNMSVSYYGRSDKKDEAIKQSIEKMKQFSTNGL